MYRARLYLDVLVVYHHEQRLQNNFWGFFQQLIELKKKIKANFINCAVRI
jgi:hypothetical protein